jgi:F0F1-type ATP synthase epsilon subunit
VNIPAESGEMGILANHVPAIEQLKPGLVEIIEEAGASKQFFRMLHPFTGELEVAFKDSGTILRTWN